MYQSYWDSYPLANPRPNSTELNIDYLYRDWSAAARQVWLYVFAPNDRHRSRLRPSLLAEKLDSLNFYYIGTDLI